MAPDKVRSERVARLAQRQVLRWEIQHPHTRAEPTRPCVALSRLPGTGGAEIGRLVAETLDYGCFDGEIVDQIASELGVDHWMLRGLDERVRSRIDRLVADAFGAQRVPEGVYFQHLARVVATLAERGRAVIVGRGAPFLVPPERGLRVLLIAPRERRIARYAEVMQLPAERARVELDRADAQRAEFVRARFGARQDDPLLYDLTLNTGTLSFELAADLIVEALRRRFPHPRPGA